MPRYFLHLVDGERLVDEDGQELPDLNAAREEAIRNVRSIMADEVGRGRLPLAPVIEVTSEAGQVLLTVLFAEAIRIDR